MEKPVRSIAKALSWQATGLVTMTVLAWCVTGDLAASGGLALLAAFVGFLMFIVHERVWARISWGRSTETGAANPPKAPEPDHAGIGAHNPV